MSYRELLFHCPTIRTKCAYSSHDDQRSWKALRVVLVLLPFGILECWWLFRKLASCYVSNEAWHGNWRRNWECKGQGHRQWRLLGQPGYCMFVGLDSDGNVKSLSWTLWSIEMRTSLRKQGTKNCIFKEDIHQNHGMYYLLRWIDVI